MAVTGSNLPVDDVLKLRSTLAWHQLPPGPERHVHPNKRDAASSQPRGPVSVFRLSRLCSPTFATGKPSTCLLYTSPSPRD